MSVGGLLLLLLLLLFFFFLSHWSFFFFFLSHWLTLGLVWSSSFFFFLPFCHSHLSLFFFFSSFSPVFLCFSLHFSPVFLADQWRSSKYTENPNLKKKKKKPIEVKMKSRTKLNMHNIFQNKSRFLNQKKKIRSKLKSAQAIVAPSAANSHHAPSKIAGCPSKASSVTATLQEQHHKPIAPPNPPISGHRGYRSRT